MLAYQTYDVSTVLILLALLVAVIMDLRRNRIPNWLTFGTLFIALSLQFTFLGSDGLLGGLAGAGTGLVLLLPFFLLGGMGAGDVKMMAAIGAFIGVQSVMWAAAFSLCLAGIYAVSLVTYRGEWMNFFQRYLVTVKVKSYVPPAKESIAHQRFPFALAIAGGTLGALALDSQLSFYHLSTELNYQWQLWGAGQ